MSTTRALKSPAAFYLGLTLAIGFAIPSIGGAIPDEAKIGGFAIGAQAWTFNRFSVFEAIEKNALAGARVIELFPGQKLSATEPDAKFDHNASDEIIQKVKDKLAQHKMHAVNYGVVGAGSEAEWRRIFEMGKKLGLHAITTENVQDLDLIEKLVKEFDIRVGIHEHPRRPDNPDYKVWDPKYVLSVIKSRDPRIGACADTGHWASSGVNPLESLKLLSGRIVSVHLKDRPEIGRSTEDVAYGAGVLDVKALLDELRAQKFQGNIAIEHETNWENNVPDVAQCIGFVRGYGACSK